MKKSVTFVEIDVDHCSLVYGVSPCTAQLGVTGTRKCYNTFATTQSADNYAPVPRTIRFAVASDHLKDVDQGSIPAIPSVVTVSHRPARIRIAEDLGERASVTISFQDHPDSDINQDPYIDERPNPPGTFWGRFRARHKFILGRPLRWIDGFTDQTIAQMTTRHYIIESIAGPDIAGRVTITAKDVLKLADGKRAQVPRLSVGELSVDINETDTTATLSPAGIGNLEYPASGKVAIGKEIMSFTRSGDTLTITRAQSGTEADSHESGERVQIVKIYTKQTAAVIINDLLTNGADVPASLIDLTDWNERDPGRQYTAEIAEPESVRKLVGEIMEQAQITIFFDEIANTIRYRSLADLATPTRTVDEDIIAFDSFSQKDQFDKRVSQSWVYYGKVNPLEREDDNQNYVLSVANIDPGSQSANQWGQPAIKTIFSRWIPRDAGAVANQLSSLVLSRFINPPRSFSFGMQSGIKPDIVMGSTIQISAPTLQDDRGDRKNATVNVIARADAWSGNQFECEEQLFIPFDPDDPGAPGPLPNIPIEESENNINLREVFDNSGLGVEPDDTTVVTFIIRDGIIIGSDDPNFPSLVVGDWPSGATITLQINATAFVSGAGGQAGNGGDVFAASATSGQAGGTAIVADRAIAIVNNGTIQGGGGGGGGGRSSLTFDGVNLFYTAGGGGGGGAGAIAGSGDVVAGADGSLTAGGAGGPSRSATIGVTGAGGNGGDPGQAGQNGTDTTPPATGFAGPAGAGGAAGVAIDGDSFVTLTGSGTVLGNQIN
jgi:hypothetical protein